MFDYINNLHKLENTSELFEENNTEIYNYCPSVIKDKNIYHTFYCSNKNNGIIKDYIYYTKSIEIQDNIYYTDKIQVLAPSKNGWDSEHVCDPSVIEGNFVYNNKSYKYLMAYLGCNTKDNQQNKIGLAVSNDLEKDWEKVGDSPFIDFYYNYDKQNYFQWGIGQPSLLNYNDYIIIFYTQGTWNLTSTIAEIWDLQDLNNPIKIDKFTISNNGTNDFISNADFALKDNYIYMICDKHPFEGNVLNNIPNASYIYKTKMSDINDLKNCNWEYVENISLINSGYNKNHNTCLIKNNKGEFQDSILYTSATEKNTFLNSLWTYRIKKYDL